RHDASSPSPPPSLRCQPQFQINKSETPPKRQVNQGQRAIRNVHRSYYVKVVWHENPLIRGPTIGQLQSLLAPPLPNFHESQQFSENLRRLATIDLLDDENKLTVGSATRRLDCLHEE